MAFTALLQGNEIPATTDSSLVLAHFYRRSAWQAISKSGFLKVLAAGQQEIAKQRNSHYRETFETIRDAPEKLLDNLEFLSPSYSWIDTIKDQYRIWVGLCDTLGLWIHG